MRRPRGGASEAAGPPTQADRQASDDRAGDLADAPERRRPAGTWPSYFGNQGAAGPGASSSSSQAARPGAAAPGAAASSSPQVARPVTITLANGEVMVVIAKEVKWDDSVFSV